MMIMSETERILLECRYLLSLNKSYIDIAKYLNIDENVVITDLNNRLPKLDQILYNRVTKKLKKINKIN